MRLAKLYELGPFLAKESIQVSPNPSERDSNRRTSYDSRVAICTHIAASTTAKTPVMARNRMMIHLCYRCKNHDSPSPRLVQLILPTHTRMTYSDRTLVTCLAL